MNFSNKIIFFIILIITNFYGDLEINNFKHNFNSKFAYIFLFIHSIISTYFIFGSFIFGYYKLHLLFILLISIQLYFRDFNCLLTDKTNEVFNGNKNLDFYSNHKQILYFIFNLNIKTIHKYSKIIGLITLLILLIFDIFMIFKKL